ncbi:MAG: GNAT family N-acetyltransferase [Chloracidobacterium sp.]|nr:GNAT family N-acetyltransferase [Chloracidobacterium sp.]MCO5332453.1 GNAT family N-acetyltransferase [Pyrinomonadaceae bacterium]
MELRILDLAEKADELFASDDCQAIFAMYEDFYPTIGFVPPWVGYFVVRDGLVVGCCGFVGQPQDGKVEVAYATFKEFEGRGIASFSCSELLKIAYANDPSLMVTAKTAPEENASVAILRKNGFIYSGIVQDHEIGNAWLWIHDKDGQRTFDVN